MITGFHPKLRALLATFDTGMLATRDAAGRMHARPMALARCLPEGKLLFLTSIQGGPATEVEDNPRVAVTLQGARKYVSLIGTARLSVDRAVLDSLWSPALKVWFPQGKDDPSLCILEVDVDAAEYWDMRGVHGLAFLVESARALLNGVKGSPRDTGAHGRMS